MWKRLKWAYSYIQRVERKKKNKNMISYPINLSYIKERKIRTFPDKENLADFVTSSPTLQD